MGGRRADLDRRRSTSPGRRADRPAPPPTACRSARDPRHRALPNGRLHDPDDLRPETCPRRSSRRFCASPPRSGWRRRSGLPPEGALPAAPRRRYRFRPSRLGVLFDPHAFDWRDADVLRGNALILGAALCWSVSFLYNARASLGRDSIPAHPVASPSRRDASDRPRRLFGWASGFCPQFGVVVAILYNGAIGTALGFLGDDGRQQDPAGVGHGPLAFSRLPWSGWPFRRPAGRDGGSAPRRGQSDNSPRHRARCDPGRSLPNASAPPPSMEE